MSLRLVMLIAALSLLFSVSACKKKEKPVSQPPVPMPPVSKSPSEAPAQGIAKPRGEVLVVVPDSVKGKWESVRIEILDKSSNKKEEATIKLNSEYGVPGSGLKIKVGEFLPDFRMDGLTITSASGEPKNPAVHITVFDGDNQIFKGWLYSKFPNIHPFQHEKYGLLLIDGLKAGDK